MKMIRATIMGCLMAFMMLAPSLAHATLAVSIGDGSFARSGAMVFTFPSNSATVTGGSGSYTYIWSNTNDGNAVWSGGSGQSFAPQVTIGGPNCNESRASYTVTVTDTVTGNMATSNAAVYFYVLMIPGEGC
jgi:hypothetical protein